MMDWSQDAMIGGGESYHEHNGVMFVVDKFSDSEWSCSDQYYTVRREASTKAEAIKQAFKAYDDYTQKRKVNG
jgi:hypothetical protein